jgi:hypothetical protein
MGWQQPWRWWAGLEPETKARARSIALGVLVGGLGAFANAAVLTWAGWTFVALVPAAYGGAFMAWHIGRLAEQDRELKDIRELVASLDLPDSTAAPTSASDGPGRLQRLEHRLDPYPRLTTVGMGAVSATIGGASLIVAIVAVVTR